MSENKLKWSDVTPKSAFLNRRQLIASAGAAALVGSVASPALAKLKFSKSGYGRDLDVNSYEDITTYNNFYEFGTGKGDPAENAHTLTTDPTPRAIAEERAPRAVHWVTRLHDAGGVEGEWQAADEPLRPAVKQLLMLAGKYYLPYLAANRAAIEATENPIPPR